MQHVAPLLTRKLPTFAQAFDPKNNAFGFLRLTLAVFVIFSHTFPLGGFGIDAIESISGGKHTIGLVAVSMFFVLSGFLICRSAAGSASIVRFLWHRFLRIMPGYWVCLVVCACVFAPFYAWVEHGMFFRVFAAPQKSPLAYMLGNAGLFHLSGRSFLQIVGIHPLSIAGLLQGNPFPNVINGSLWTLSFEVCCYIATAVLALLGILRRGKRLVLLLFVALWALHAFGDLNPAAFAHWAPVAELDPLVRLVLFFCAGCLCFLYRERIRCSALLATVGVAVLVASLPLGFFGVVAPILLPYAFLCLAFKLPFARFDAKGDFSYGTYIYAFPVQQALALLRVQEGGFGLFFLWSLAVTLILAVVSYRLIEAPCLRLKNLNLSDALKQLRRVPRPPAVMTTALVIPLLAPGTRGDPTLS